MLFIDHAKIEVKAGDGGRGCVSFRREAHVPRGGPDGGDGGKGGDVVLKASAQLSTLLDLKYRRHYRVRRAANGEGKNKTGKNSADLIIPLPLGSVVKDAETGETLADLTEEGQVFVAARGGKGGRGNARFASSTRQAPTYAQPGRKGEERRVFIELKLLADVGLVGLPNAGKSTLLSRISSARPKVAAYPFTTLKPLLGTVRWAPYKDFVMADIPGLIEGAHAGKGLGLRFLQHIERTRLLAFLVDVSEGPEGDPAEQLELLRGELQSYHPGLLEKPFVVVGTKVDAKGRGARLKRLAAACQKDARPFFPISAVTGTGLTALIHELGRRVEGAGAPPKTPPLKKTVGTP